MKAGTRVLTAALSTTLSLVATAAQPGERTDVLNEHSFWRYHLTWKTEMVVRKGGKLEPIPDTRGRTPKVSVYDLPPSDWAAREFDDRSWARTRTGVPVSSRHGLLCLRGKFAVSDPAKAAGLTLSGSFVGGAAVYVNGRELVREGLPAGKLEPTTAATPLPEEAYVDPEGYLYRNQWGDPERYKERLRSRVRQIQEVEIPEAMLRKGVNVVAVGIHRAPANEVLLTGKPRRWKAERWRGRSYYWWSRIGFRTLRLTAPAGSDAAVPNVGRPKTPGLQLWNHPLIRRIHTGDYGDPNEPLRPLVMAGARNGTASAQFGVGSAKALRGLVVKAAELRGPNGAVMSADAVEVRFLRRDGDVRGSFGSLIRKPPAEVKGTQAVWVRVRVPQDARPGKYAGALTVSAEGTEPVEVRLALTVYDWAVPDPQGFTSHVGLVQSPESLAMQYGEPLWSERHWELIDRSFALLGQVGCKVIHIPLIRRTHFGNEHSMVRWVRKPDGGFTHDFTLVARYLDIALKHLGKPPVVCFYCWEIYTGGKYLNHKARGQGKGMCFTVRDPKTGKLEAAEGPRWGDGKVVAFWKPVFEGLRTILKERGLEDSFMLGIAGDTRPTKEAGADLKAAAPWAKFVVHSHARASNIWGVPVGYLADVWSAPSAPWPPKRRHGWKASFRRTTFARAGSNTVGAMRPWTPLAMWAVSLEAMQTAGIHGFGRMGADFWDVIKSRRGRRSILGRFPESTWAQLKMSNSSPWVLAPGPEGAVPTVRFEMIRHAQQMTEARIFIERALTDPAQRVKLGAEWAGRIHNLLDDRVRAILYGRSSWTWFLSSDWRARDAALLAAAAKVAAALR
jgi:hypothetical protein